MISGDKVSEILLDTRRMQAAALERLDAGDIRDGTEKSWR